MCPMAQDRSTKTISMIKWIRNSRLSIKNSHSLSDLCVRLDKLPAPPVVLHFAVSSPGGGCSGQGCVRFLVADDVLVEGGGGLVARLGAGRQQARRVQVQGSEVRIQGLGSMDKGLGSRG